MKYFLILLIFVAVELDAMEWHQVTVENYSNIHASGSTAVAWDGPQVSVSTDGGMTWGPGNQPIGSGSQTPEAIRVARASRDGRIWILTETGNVYCSQPGSGWIDWSRQNRLGGIAVLTVDGEGTVWIMSGADMSIYAIVHGILDRKSKGRGIPFITCGQGIVALQGNLVTQITVRQSHSIGSSESLEDLPKPFTLARATSPLEGAIFTQDGKEWTVHNERLAGWSSIPDTQVINIAVDNGRLIVLGIYEGRLLLMERRRSGWGPVANLGRQELPPQTTGFTVTDRCILVTTALGIYALEK